MIVCHCHGTTDSQVQDALVCGARCSDDVGRQCGGAGLSCGGCRPLIDALVERVSRQAQRTEARDDRFSSVA